MRLVLLCLCLALSACQGADGPAGLTGPAGPSGPAGPEGPPGAGTTFLTATYDVEAEACQAFAFQSECLFEWDELTADRIDQAVFLLYFRGEGGTGWINVPFTIPVDINQDGVVEGELHTDSVFAEGLFALVFTPTRGVVPRVIEGETRAVLLLQSSPNARLSPPSYADLVERYGLPD